MILNSNTIKCIKVSSPSFSKNADLVEKLKNAFPNADIQTNPGGVLYRGTELVEFFRGADAVIVGTEKFTDSVIGELPGLRVVSKYGVGLDNVDLGALASRGIKFAWKGGVNRRSVSEMALAFLIGLSRNLFFTNANLRKGEWVKEGGDSLSGRTVGIIGCGYIGEDLVRLLQPFHCKILINDILDKSHLVSCYGVKQVEIDEILHESDLISLHVPLTGITANSFDKTVFSKMKKGSMLVNTCRGGVVVQEDLKYYLNLALKGDEKATLIGAATDVYEVEPETDIEFLSLPNLFGTPHTGGNAREAVLAMGMAAIRGLIEYETGEHHRK